MAQIQPRFTTLREADSDTKSRSLWAMNRTNPRGPLNITVSDGNSSTVVVLPHTFIPVDLTTQATRENLLRCSDFRRMVTMGVVMLVQEDSAEEIMSQPDAQKEAQLVYSRTVDVDLAAPAPVAASPELKKADAESSGKLSGFALTIVESGTEEDTMLSMIRGQDGILTVEDYEYIATNVSFSKVKQYCAEAALILTP